MELFGGIFIGLGFALLACALCMGFFRYRTYRRRKKFAAFVERLKSTIIKDETKEELKKGREVSELNFRDKSGVFTTVKIVVDHDLPDMIADNKEQLAEMIRKGDAGTMSDLLAGHRIEDDGMKKVQEFVFSPRSVHEMRKAGMEPDEVVTKMLKASGRMD